MKIKSMEWILHCNMSDAFTLFAEALLNEPYWTDNESMLFGTKIALNILS